MTGVTGLGIGPGVGVPLLQPVRGASVGTHVGHAFTGVAKPGLTNHAQRSVPSTEFTTCVPTQLNVAEPMLSLYPAPRVWVDPVHVWPSTRPPPGVTGPTDPALRCVDFFLAYCCC